MRNNFRRIAVMIAVAILVIACCGIHTSFAAGGVSVFVVMDNYVAGEQITVMWYTNIAGADHYDCTVKNESTGSYPRSRSTSSSGYDCYVSGSKVEAGNYKVWVGAVDGNGNVLDDGCAYFTVNEATACDHKWNAETGTCKLCGDECPHNNGVYEIEADSVGKSLSDTKHEIIYTYDEVCKICRYVLSSDLTKKETGKHSFDSNGDCVLCDYRAACKHSETTTELLNTTYELHDELQHIVKKVSNIICANKNCGKVLGFGGTIESYYENHNMQNNRCTLCGYAIQYDPVAVSISRGQASAYVGETITASCSASGGSGDYTYYWYVYCNGSEIYTTGFWDKHGSIVASSEGEYSFSVRVEDKNTGSSVSASTASISVTKAPCQHPNKTTIQDGEVQYIKASDSKHTIRTSWAEVCGDCGAKLSAWYSDETQDHNYVNGNCVNCGSAEPAPSPVACTHPSMRSVEANRTTRTIASDEQHLVDITWEDYCEACGILLNKTRTTTEYQAHTYNGLVCTLCGYAKQAPSTSVPCDHANHKEEELSRQVDPYNDQMHVVRITYRVSCADCGILLNDAYLQEQYINHTLENGKCKDCTYEISEVGRAVLDTQVQYESSEMHKIISTIRISYSNGTTNDITETDYEYHQYDGYTCVRCQYVNCSHELTIRSNESTSIARNYNDDNNTHYLVKTYTLSCACGQNREQKEDYEAVPHNFNYEGYQGTHPHEYFVRCECGVASLVNNKYHTINGAVYSLAEAQDAEHCCVCLGHVWMTDEPKEVNGEWREFCMNCGKYKTVDAPVIEEEHIHSFSLNVTSAKTHPHQVSGYCECGEYTEFLEVYAQDPNCCQCTGHLWTSVIKVGDKYIQGCTRCNFQEEVTPTDGQEAFYDVIDNFKQSAEKNGGRIWKVVAAQATEKLQDKGFVYTKYGLDAFSDMYGTIKDATLKGLKVVDEKTWDEQKQEYWTVLLVELLKQEVKAVDANELESFFRKGRQGVDIAENGAGLVNDVALCEVNDLLGKYLLNRSFLQELSSKLETLNTNLEEARKLNDESGMGSYSILINDLENQKSALNELINMESDKIAKTADEINIAGQTAGDAAVIEGEFEKIGIVMDIFGALGEGTNAASEVGNKIDDLQSIIATNAYSITILNGIIECAGSKSNLGKAAISLKNDLKQEIECATNKFADQTLAFVGTVAESLGEKVADKVAEKIIEKAAGELAGDALLPLKAIEVFGKVFDTIFDWDGAFNCAEKLMTLSVMDAEMNVLGASQNSENYQYYAQLWALLQAKGDEYAVQMLDEWQKGAGLSMTDFGIASDTDRLVEKIELGDEHQQYRFLLEALGWNGEMEMLDIWETE